MHTCAWCNRYFEDEDKLTPHIRRRGKHGHGDLIGSNCQKPLAECEDIDGVTGSFRCKTAKKSKPLASNSKESDG